MFPLLSQEILDKIRRWDELKRWERREIGQQLRRMGLSYREIAALVPVAKGTLSGWCRDIELDPRHLVRVASNVHGRSTRRRVGSMLRSRRLQQIADLRERGRQEAASLFSDPEWVAGTTAYWAEGSKRSNELSFSNSDSNLICVFVAWARRFLDVGTDRFTVRLHLHDGQDESERRVYWSTVTGLPVECFRKGFTKPEGSGHRKNVLYNGTALVRIRRSTDLLHRVLGWIDALAEHWQTSG